MTQSKILIELSSLFPTQSTESLEQIMLFRKSQCDSEEKLLELVIEDILSNTKNGKNLHPRKDQTFVANNQNKKTKKNQNKKTKEKEVKKIDENEKEKENHFKNWESLSMSELLEITSDQDSSFEDDDEADENNDLNNIKNKIEEEEEKEKDEKLIKKHQENTNNDTFDEFQLLIENNNMDLYNYPFTEKNNFVKKKISQTNNEKKQKGQPYQENKTRKDDNEESHPTNTLKEKKRLENKETEIEKEKSIENEKEKEKQKQKQNEKEKGKVKKKKKEKEKEKEKEKGKGKEKVIKSEQINWTFLNIPESPIPEKKSKPKHKTKKKKKHTKKQKFRPKLRNFTEQLKGIEKYIIQLFPIIPKDYIRDVIKQFQNQLIFNEKEAVQKVIKFLTENFLSKNKNNTLEEKEIEKEKEIEIEKGKEIEKEMKKEIAIKTETETKKENENENEKEHEEEEEEEEEKENENENDEDEDLKTKAKIGEFTVQQLFYQILEIFPDIKHQYLYNLICKDLDLPEESFEERFEIELNQKKLKNKKNKIRDPKTGYNVIVNKIMNLKEYPKQQKNKNEVLLMNPKYKDVNWFENKDPVDKIYQKEALSVLLQEFSKLSTTLIKRELRNHGFRYAPTYKDLKLVKEPEKNNNFFSNLFTRKNSEISLTSERLIIETRFVKDEERRKIEKIDLELAEKINEDEYEQSGCKIDCMCCYAKVPFEKMVSCKAGHLFCVDCLHNLVKYAIGARKKEIRCPGVEKCDFGFSLNMIQKAVPEKTWDLFERLVQESEISQAKIENLRKCPNCDYAVIIEDIQETQILECKNPRCLSKTCLLCNERAHPGKTCEEFKKGKKVDTERLFIEEEMTKALLRTCNNCNQMYYKTQGCNKIVCSNCGEIMCYLCQKSINKEKYKHFSKTGEKCRLWTTQEEDIRRVQKAKKEAKKKMKKLKKKLENEKGKEKENKNKKGKKKKKRGNKKKKIKKEKKEKGLINNKKKKKKKKTFKEKKSNLKGKKISDSDSDSDNENEKEKEKENREERGEKKKKKKGKKEKELINNKKLKKKKIGKEKGMVKGMEMEMENEKEKGKETENRKNEKIISDDDNEFEKEVEVENSEEKGKKKKIKNEKKEKELINNKKLKKIKIGKEKGKEMKKEKEKEKSNQEEEEEEEEK
ncbi:e3 ubiquitin-protein ligase [Anaeramoeba flamelloides]|uniref:E3 ubiquitin-protein ligase n=1 Tax=Anaeramoeba flamelloides TaxID=1746091 RepID=A0AAV7ZUQ0_9EUKA|nr:e3 ubiquitin-protein ligase [Anaeramoeba flamelloides]